MASLVKPVEPPISVSDQHFIQTGVSWQRFKNIQAGFTESTGVRLFYYEGELEIVGTSAFHEMLKSMIGMLIEIYLVEKGIEFVPMGSFTQEREGVASIQADECYCIGEQKQIPDLSVEVALTSGGPSKLNRYQALEVAEVWFWQDNQLLMYRLQRSSGDQSDYQRVYCSSLFPDLDVEQFTQCVLMESRVEAAKRFRQSLS
jgi:Uma2 family endonuclease